MLKLIIQTSFFNAVKTLQRVP